MGGGGARPFLAGALVTRARLSWLVVELMLRFPQPGLPSSLADDSSSLKPSSSLPRCTAVSVLCLGSAGVFDAAELDVVLRVANVEALAMDGLLLAWGGGGGGGKACVEARRRLLGIRSIMAGRERVRVMTWSSRAEAEGVTFARDWRVRRSSWAARSWKSSSASRSALSALTSSTSASLMSCIRRRTSSVESSNFVLQTRISSSTRKSSRFDFCILARLAS